MKTLSVLFLALTVAATATVLVNVALGVTVCVAAGLAAIAVHDYSRRTRVLALPATMAVGSRTEKFGLAA